VLLGLAAVHAEQLDTQLAPIAVWDGGPGDGLGDTLSCVERWRVLGYVYEIIELDKILRKELPELITTSMQAVSSPRTESQVRVGDVPLKIVAIMFADAKGFSKLTEEQVPLFVQQFLGMVGEMVHAMDESGQRPPAVMNTWGDGLFFIFEDVTEAARFALNLCDRVRNINWANRGLEGLTVRIGLHAGPAQPITDPVTGRPNFIGTNISHAARIEPITPPNEVYASQHFAALAALDRANAFKCEYVGQTPLAKDFGTYPIYVVVHRVPPRRGDLK
jgi:class 3 adenylate cyclase